MNSRIERQLGSTGLTSERVVVADSNNFTRHLYRVHVHAFKSPNTKFSWPRWTRAPSATAATWRNATYRDDPIPFDSIRISSCSRTNRETSGHTREVSARRTVRVYRTKRMRWLRRHERRARKSRELSKSRGNLTPRRRLCGAKTSPTCGLWHLLNLILASPPFLPRLGLPRGMYPRDILKNVSTRSTSRSISLSFVGRFIRDLPFSFCHCVFYILPLSIFSRLLPPARSTSDDVSIKRRGSIQPMASTRKSARSSGGRESFFEARGGRRFRGEELY